MATTTSDSLESLEPFVGDWTMAVAFGCRPSRIPARVSASSGCRESGS